MTKEEEARPLVVPEGHRAGTRRRPIEPAQLPALADVYARTWYLVQVASGRELLIADLMTSRGHAAIVPMIRCWRRANGRVKRQSERLFPMMARYLILGFAPTAMQPFDDLRRYSFVQRVVSDGNGYAPIARRQLIDFIKLLGSVIWTIDPEADPVAAPPELCAGDVVTIVSGPLRDHRVTLDRIEGSTAYFTTTMFDRLMNLHLPLAVCRKAA